ncbi:MAG: DUF4920 domain-containing protein [Planctomycetota bacterium]|nr:DUF4920 domain-containing protein [Planctomycetota bacterium]
MPLRLLPLAALVCLLAAGCQTTSPYATAREEGWHHYGANPDVSHDLVALGAVKGDEQDIIVHGTITKMCTTSGCWALITDDHGGELFVMCEDKGFHLPTDAIGHELVAHGDGHVNVTPVEQRRHFAEVSGATPEEIEAITEPQYTIMLIADSVYLRGDDLSRAYTPEEAAEACEAAEHEHAGEATHE